MQCPVDGAQRGIAPTQRLHVGLQNGSTVLQAMDGNSNYPTPSPSLADVSDALDDFLVKLAIANKRSRPEETAAKNEQKEVLAALLKRLAFYVNTTAGSVLSVLLGSGFPISNYPLPGQVPTVVSGAQLTDGRQRGQVRLDFNKQQHVLMYEYRYGIDNTDPDTWDVGEPLFTTSSRNNIIASLPEAKRCYVQVRAINGHGKSDWNELVSILVR